MKKVMYSVLGGLLLVGTAGASFAAEPQTLDLAQMDSVTAAGGSKSKGCECSYKFIDNDQRVVNAGRINSGGGDDVNAVALNIINASVVDGPVTAIAIAYSN